MAWYQNPTIAAILGGIAGALLSVLASVYIWRRTQKIKRIDCIINDISSLLSVSEKIRDQLSVSFSGSPVNAVYLISMDILNTGTEAVENQPINIRLAEGSKILDYSIKTEPPVGFGKITEQSRKDHCLDLRVDLMNPGDIVSIEAVSIDNSSDEIDVYLKNANVQSRVISKQSADSEIIDLMSDKNMFALAMMSAIPFLGGFAKSMINVGLAQRIGRLGIKK